MRAARSRRNAGKRPASAPVWSLGWWSAARSTCCALCRRDQNETLFVFDLTLPADFLPVNQDGEVAGHLRANVDTALDIMADCAMTVDTTLVTLDALQRLVPQRFAPDNNR